MKIKDADIDDDVLDKGMCDYSLREVDDMTLQFAIGFCNPRDISNEITEPDILQITFKLPELIVDAESYESLKAEEIVYEVELQPQMSESEFQQLIEAAQTAAKVGVTVSFWQIVLFFSLGKALKSMWSLLNAAQFLIYMSLWQVKVDK